MSPFKKHISQSSHASKYKKQLDAIVLPLLKPTSHWSEETLVQLWQTFESFPIPLLVIERLDPFWNRLLLLDDKNLAATFMDGFRRFYEHFGEERLIKTKFNVYLQAFEAYFP